MREQLIRYIDLLFAGTPRSEDIKQEILQNTLDRYDDLIAQGKTPEAAYSLAISGIGDIHEILEQADSDAAPQCAPVPKQNTDTPKATNSTRLIRAAAIAFFILCPVPVLILENTIGVCLLLAMVAAGVALLVFCGKDTPQEQEQQHSRSPLNRTLLNVAWIVGICIYLFLSISTGTWHITWLMVPIIFCTCGLIDACFTLNKVFLRAVIRIVLFAVLIVVLTVSLLGGYLGFNLLPSFIEDHEMLDGTASSSGQVSAQQVKDIAVEWVSGSITLQPGETDHIQFSETGAFDKGGQMIWKVSGDRLLIQFCRSQFGINLFGTNNAASKDLIITVPQNWLCDELDIDSVSARIDIAQLHAREAQIINVSGQCSFTDCVITDFSAETVSGKVEYEGQLDSLDFSTVSADCTAEVSSCPKEIALEGVSGNLTLTLPAECGFTLSLDTVSGDFSSDYATTSEDNRYLYGDGVCDISADTVSGDVRIKQPN